MKQMATNFLLLESVNETRSSRPPPTCWLCFWSLKLLNVGIIRSLLWVSFSHHSSAKILKQLSVRFTINSGFLILVYKTLIDMTYNSTSTSFSNTHSTSLVLSSYSREACSHLSIIIWGILSNLWIGNHLLWCHQKCQVFLDHLKL